MTDTFIRDANIGLVNATLVILSRVRVIIKHKIMRLRDFICFAKNGGGSLYNSYDIANRIKSMSKTKKIHLKTMLDDLGYGINTISEMSKGKQMSYISFAKIADYLDCSVDYLLGRTENPEVNR